VRGGPPVEFMLNQVIPGWTEGVSMMPVGAKYRFWVPSDLAYGEKGAGAQIGPNSTLVFDVELLAISP
jgi:FKBP-type peptidyl-prolyl cis-trans isomerase FkpA